MLDHYRKLRSTRIEPGKSNQKRRGSRKPIICSSPRSSRHSLCAREPRLRQRGCVHGLRFKRSVSRLNDLGQHSARRGNTATQSTARRSGCLATPVRLRRAPNGARSTSSRRTYSGAVKCRLHRLRGGGAPAPRCGRSLLSAEARSIGTAPPRRQRHHQHHRLSPWRFWSLVNKAQRLRTLPPPRWSCSRRSPSVAPTTRWSTHAVSAAPTSNTSASCTSPPRLPRSFAIEQSLEELLLAARGGSRFDQRRRSGVHRRSRASRRARRTHSQLPNLAAYDALLSNAGGQSPSDIDDRIKELFTLFKLPTLATECVRRFRDAHHDEALEVLRETLEAEFGERRVRRCERLLPRVPLATR